MNEECGPKGCIAVGYRWVKAIYDCKMGLICGFSICDLARRYATTIAVVAVVSCLKQFAIQIKKGCADRNQIIRSNRHDYHFVYHHVNYYEYHRVHHHEYHYVYHHQYHHE